ncbi:Uncharacterized protein Fot_52187 [Forsythia ovata]|uniref:Uncharacterized protein n=1 Tax=Forsythia ovata TaxID=205694 RepID=A0ABD1PNT5_9LAMI
MKENDILFCIPIKLEKPAGGIQVYRGLSQAKEPDKWPFVTVKRISKTFMTIPGKSWKAVFGIFFNVLFCVIERLRLIDRRECGKQITGNLTKYQVSNIKLVLSLSVEPQEGPELHHEPGQTENETTQKGKRKTIFRTLFSLLEHQRYTSGHESNTSDTVAYR